MKVKPSGFHVTLFATPHLSECIGDGHGWFVAAQAFSPILPPPAIARPTTSHYNNYSRFLNGSKIARRHQSPCHHH